jgi:hypothetical protein
MPWRAPRAAAFNAHMTDHYQLRIFEQVNVGVDLDGGSVPVLKAPRRRRHRDRQGAALAALPDAAP